MKVMEKIKEFMLCIAFGAVGFIGVAMIERMMVLAGM